MSGRKVWFITGAGRGMGVDLTAAVLAAGHAVVATGRNPDAVARAIGEADDLLKISAFETSRGTHALWVINATNQTKIRSKSTARSWTVEDLLSRE